MGNAQSPEVRLQRSRAISPESSMGNSARSQSRSIHQKLVREHDRDSDLRDFYEIVDEIGQGGLCKVYKIRKRHEMIGGSSREGNIKRKKSRFGITHSRRSRMASSPNLQQQFMLPPVTTTSRRSRTASSPNLEQMFNMPDTTTDSQVLFDSKDGTALTPTSSPSHHHGSEKDAISEPSMSPKQGRTANNQTDSSLLLRPQELQQQQREENEKNAAADQVESDDSGKRGSNHDVPIPRSVPLENSNAAITATESCRGCIDSMDLSDDDVTGYFGPQRSAQSSSTPSSNLYFALKEINLAMVKEDKIDQLKNEVEILKALDHKNIIKAYETFFSKQTKKLMIVMELCTGGDLHSRLPYKEANAARIVQQILSAVSYIHERNIVHRDLKMENVMFENEHPESIVKLIDFGLSKEYNQKDNILSERVGTLYSMSPETMLGDYNTKADMWSMGVCTYMLLANGSQPFAGKTPKQIVAKVLTGRYSFEGLHWTSISEDAKDFVRTLLVVKQEDRLSAKDAKQHAWLQKASEYREQAAGGNEVDEAFKERVRECIVRYAQSGDFMKLALNVIAKNSSAEDIFQLRAVFDEFDKDDTGTLTFNEFKEALGQFKYSEDDIEEIFQKIDVNKNNEINYTEFLAAALETQGRVQEYRLAEAFDVMDCDDSGYISRENLRQIVGDSAGEDYIDQLIAEADFLNDGRISYAEFLHAFNKRNHELVYNLYELEREESLQSEQSKDSDEEVLRRFGIVKTIRRAINSTEALKEMGHAAEKTRANGTGKKSSALKVRSIAGGSQGRGRLRSNSSNIKAG